MSLLISFLIRNEYNLPQEDLFQNTETFSDLLVQTPRVLLKDEAKMNLKPSHMHKNLKIFFSVCAILLFAIWYCLPW